MTEYVPLSNAAIVRIVASLKKLFQNIYKDKWQFDFLLIYSLVENGKKI